MKLSAYLKYAFLKTSLTIVYCSFLTLLILNILHHITVKFNKTGLYNLILLIFAHISHYFKVLTLIFNKYKCGNIIERSNKN